MYSDTTLEWLRKKRRRLLVRRWRQGTLLALLLAVAFWGLLTYLADHRTFAWDDVVEVAVVAILDSEGRGDAADADRFVQRFVSRTASPRGNLRQVENWIRREYARHTGDDRAIIRFVIRGPVRPKEAPPTLPRRDAPFLERLRETRRFLGFFSDLAAREDLLPGSCDVTLFVYFYDMYDRSRRDLFRQRDSTASRRDRVGVVFAPLSHEVLGHTCALIAHELCHTLGATDKYADRRCAFPEGFADPNRTPLYPQIKAEIMALGRPVAPGKEEPVEDLDDCVVGRKTAEEMNWVAAR